MLATATPPEISWRELPLADGLGEAAESYPDTRIGAFDFSEVTGTEVLGHASGSAHRASIASCREVATDLGFYTQPDPVGLQGGNVHGLNLLYSYATLNPLSLTDPLGLEVKTVGCDPSANRRIQAAAGDADAASATCLTCPDDSGPFRQKIRNLTVYCVGSEVSRGLPICGRAGSQNPHGGWTWWKRSIALTPEGISGGGGCNCLKALILHETLHLLKYQDSGEKDPFAEERRCFPSCFQPVAASVTVR